MPNFLDNLGYSNEIITFLMDSKISNLAVVQHIAHIGSTWSVCGSYLVWNCSTEYQLCFKDVLWTVEPNFYMKFFIIKTVKTVGSQKIQNNVYWVCGKCIFLLLAWHHTGTWRCDGKALCSSPLDGSVCSFYTEWLGNALCSSPLDGSVFSFYNEWVNSEGRKEGIASIQ